jgi:hypothetical protein
MKPCKERGKLAGFSYEKKFLNNKTGHAENGIKE